jgi:hypothetical protein
MKINREKKRKKVVTPPGDINNKHTYKMVNWTIKYHKYMYIYIPLSVSFQTIPCKTTLVPGSHEPKDDSSVTDDWSIVLGCVWWLVSLFNDSSLVIVSLFVGRDFFFKERNE